jgi:MATE family multidrug resistance protein
MNQEDCPGVGEWDNLGSAPGEEAFTMSHSAVLENAAIEPAGPPETAGRSVQGKSARQGGSWELLALALPLVVSQSFMTVQVFVDTILLSWHDQREMAATLPAIMWYWLPFGLLQVTAGYVSTFVAQYTGARRPERVGPAVWQGIHFAILAGLLFLIMVSGLAGTARRCKCSRSSICAVSASRPCRC